MYTKATCRLVSLSIVWSTLTVVVQSQQTVNSLTPKREASDTQVSDENGHDNPALRALWFLKGRRAPAVGFAGSPISPAQRLLRSFEERQEMNQVPLTQPSHKLGPGFAGATPEWEILGPAPQKSIYWGPVSGRVTSLAADLKGDPDGNTLYVGTAYGGLWVSNNIHSATPQYAALGDKWPSLSVGSVALASAVSVASPPVIYVGTGEANNAGDSYYGIGILKSTDGGSSWTLSTGKGNSCPLPLPATLPADACPDDGPFVGGSVSRILVDPSSSKHVLASITQAWGASGKTPGLAIYESINGGDSWSPTTLDTPDGALQSYNCTDIVYDSGSKSFFASVTGLGIYNSKGGGHWQPTNSPFKALQINNDTFSRASLSARIKDGKGIIYALIADSNGRLPATGPDTGLVQSLDGGKNWTQLKAPPKALFFSDPLYQGVYDQYLAAPANSDILVIGGIDVWATQSTTSISWRNLTRSYDYKDDVAHPASHTHPDQHAIITLDSKRWILGNDGGVWETTNSGVGWRNLNTNINTIQFTSVSAVRLSSPNYIGGSQDNGTAVGTKGSLNWDSTLRGDGGYTANSTQSATRLYTEQYGASLYQSDDGGAHWKSVVDGNTINTASDADGGAFYLPYKVIPGAVDEIVLGTRRVWQGPAAPSVPTPNWQPGQGWSATSDLLCSGDDYIQAVTYAPKSPKTVYVATSCGRVLVNLNIDSTAESWTEITTSALPRDRAFAALAVSPTNSDKVYLGIQGFGTGHVFVTSDRGGQWDDISPKIPGAGNRQVDTPVNAIVIDPVTPTDVYIATDIGVFVTSDDGATWHQYGPNLPHSAVVELNISTTQPRRLIAATHGRGAWNVDLLHEPGTP